MSNGNLVVQYIVDYVRIYTKTKLGLLSIPSLVPLASGKILMKTRNAYNQQFLA